MNAVLGDLLFKLIGSFAGDTSPQKNKYYGQQPGDVDPSLNVDPSQLIQQPYNSPSWATRFFHPDVASAETQKNLESYNALIDNATRNTVGASNVDLIKPYVGQDFPNVSKNNPRAASILYPNLSTEGILAGNNAAADTANNMPAFASMGRLGRAQDIIRSEAARLASRAPEKEVAAGNAQSDYTAGILPSTLKTGLAKNFADLSLTPSRMFAEGNENVARGEEAKRSIKGKDDLDALFSTGLRTKTNVANVGEALSKEQSENIPLLMAGQHQERFNTLWNIMHPEWPNTLFMRDTKTGLPVRNPHYINMMDVMQGKMSPSGKGGTIPLASSGLHLAPNGPVNSNTPTAPLTEAHTSKLTSEDLTPVVRTLSAPSSENSIYEDTDLLNLIGHWFKKNSPMLQKHDALGNPIYPK